MEYRRGIAVIDEGSVAVEQRIYNAGLTRVTTL